MNGQRSGRAVGSGKWEVGNGQWEMGSGKWGKNVGAIHELSLHFCGREIVIVDYTLSGKRL